MPKFSLRKPVSDALLEHISSTSNGANPDDYIFKLLLSGIELLEKDGQYKAKAKKLEAIGIGSPIKRFDYKDREGTILSKFWSLKLKLEVPTRQQFKREAIVYHLINAGKIADPYTA